MTEKKIENKKTGKDADDSDNEEDDDNVETPRKKAENAVLAVLAGNGTQKVRFDGREEVLELGKKDLGYLGAKANLFMDI